MAWFTGRSVVVIVLAFVLGVLVGWLWWRRRKVHFGESQAITDLNAKHKARSDELSAALARKDDDLQARDDALSAKDEEIDRLRAALDASTAGGADGVATTAGVSAGSAAWAAAPVAPAGPPAGGPADASDTDDRSGRTSPDAAALSAEEPVASAPTDISPETLAALSTPVEDLRTGTDDVPAVRDGQEPGPDAVSIVPPQPVAGVLPAAPDDSPVVEAPAEAPAPADAPAEAPAPADAPAAAEAPAAAAPTEAPAPAASEGDGAGDDLERIEGVGPRIGAALRGAGILTFRQLADADTATLQGALEQAGLRFAPSLPTWGRQARLLADGDETGFHALTQQLVGGRDVSGTK